MIAGLAKVFSTKRSNVLEFGVSGVGFMLKDGVGWCELPITEGTLSIKSDKNPLVNTYEMEITIPTTLPDSVAMSLKDAQQVFVAVTKEGKYLLVGSDRHDSMVTVKQESGGQVGDFQGDKVTVEGVAFGKLPDVTFLFKVEIPMGTDLDSSVLGFPTITNRNSLVEFPAFHDPSEYGGYNSEFYRQNIAFNLIELYLKKHTDGINAPFFRMSAGGYFNNGGVFSICDKKGSFKFSLDVNTSNTFNLELVKLKVSHYMQVDKLTKHITSDIIPLTLSNGKLEALFDIHDELYYGFELYFNNPAVVSGLEDYSISISNLKIVQS